MAALALHPMDSDQQPVSRRLEKALRKRSKKLAKRLKKADAADALDLATEALRDYHSLAVGHADPYYGRFYSARLEAAQDHEAWEEDLQALDDAQSSP